MEKLKFILLAANTYILILDKLAAVQNLEKSMAELNEKNMKAFHLVRLMCTLVEAFVRKVGKMDRVGVFWEEECQDCDEVFFKQHLRVGKNGFNKLCLLLANLERKTTNFKNTISLEKRVAIALFALGSSGEYRTIATMFGVGKSTVCELVMEFCRDVWLKLQPRYLNSSPLTRQNILEAVEGFKGLGFPQCLGALDGCHIEIRPKKKDAVDYYNYKGWYSIVLLALVDARYRFLYINVGSPGRSNDSQIFERSSLKRELQQCSLLNELSVEIGNVNVPIVIIGDSAFRFSRHLMKPYPFHLNMTPEEKNFNYMLSKSRRVVENAFGHLKARFRRIGKGIDNRIGNANAIVKACCVLHNFLIEEKDVVPPSWLIEDDECSQHPICSRNNATPIIGEAESIRRAIATFVGFDLPEHSGDDDSSRGEGDGENNRGEGDGLNAIICSYCSSLNRL